MELSNFYLSYLFFVDLKLNSCYHYLERIKVMNDYVSKKFKQKIEVQKGNIVLVTKRKSRIVRDIDESLWLEVQAQSKLEGILIKDWIEEALRQQLGSEHKRRKRLADKTNCQMCGKEIAKDGKAKNRIIVHHDKRNNRNASVAMLLCDKCHKVRHRELGWGNGGIPKWRNKGNRGVIFKCAKCRKKHLWANLGKTIRKKAFVGEFRTINH